MQIQGTNAACLPSQARVDGGRLPLDKIAETNQSPKCADTFISGCPFEEIDCNKNGHGKRKS